MAWTKVFKDRKSHHSITKAPSTGHRMWLMPHILAFIAFHNFSNAHMFYCTRNASVCEHETTGFWKGFLKYSLKRDFNTPRSPLLSSRCHPPPSSLPLPLLYGAANRGLFHPRSTLAENEKAPSVQEAGQGPRGKFSLECFTIISISI